MKHDALARWQWEQRRDDPTGMKGLITGFLLCLACCSPFIIAIILL